VTTAYRIKNWNKVYENNRTRELKRMEWVPVPNRHDGDGYTTLVDHPNGAAHLGAWLGILEVASKCEIRGTLVRGGVPHTPQSLARITRLPEWTFQEVLPRLVSTSIGWIEVISLENHEVIKPSHEDAEIPHESAAISQASDYGMERNGMEGNGKRTSASATADSGVSGPLEPFRLTGPPEASDPSRIEDAWFAEFWSGFWRKIDKAESRKVFRRHATSEARKTQILTAMRRETPLMLSRQPEHRPYAATWLNKRRYEDPIEESPAALAALGASPPLTALERRALQRREAADEADRREREAREYAANQQPAG